MPPSTQMRLRPLPTEGSTLSLAAHGRRTPAPGAGADGTGDIGTAAVDERRGWKPTEMTQGVDDQWHISGTIVFDENAHWGVPAAEEPDGDAATNLRAGAGAHTTYAPQVERFPMTRTGTGPAEQRARWPPRFACCTG